MKKIFSLLLVAFALNVSAQTTLMKSFTLGQTVDTVGNSSTDTMVVKVNSIWTNINIQVVLTNVGTRADSAARTAKIYGSIDGINFVQIGSTTYTDANASALNTGVTGVYSYEWTPLNIDKYLYYACMVTATGNDSAQVKVYITHKSTPYAPSLTTAGYQRMTSSNVVALHNKDSVKNAGIDTMTLIVAKPNFSVSVQPVIKKVSGTVLAGAQLQYSEDGTNFFDVAGDSLHCTNTSAIQTTIWTIPASAEQHQYYRVLTKGYNPTQVVTVKNYLLGK